MAKAYDLKKELSRTVELWDMSLLLAFAHDVGGGGGAGASDLGAGAGAGASDVGGGAGVKMWVKGLGLS